MIETVIKRDGTEVSFDKSRIESAIAKANKAAGDVISDRDIDLIVDIVTSYFENNDKATVEEIQDAVEDALIATGLADVAKSYIRHRQTHKDRREIQEHLNNVYNQIVYGNAADSDLRRDNANINTDAPMGQMLKAGAEGMKHFIDSFVLDEEVYKADREGWLHVHDKDFSMFCYNCCQIDLGKLLKDGFATGHGFLREPNSIRAAASLACIAIQSNQNDMFGGQSINALDYALAPYVDKSFKKAYRENVAKLMSLFIDKQAALDLLKAIEFDAKYDYCNSAKNADLIKEWAKNYEEDLTRWPSFRAVAATAWENACEDVEEETKQAMEAMIHNFNTLHSRAGSQVPFSSINYGLDTSPEGRLVTKMTLEAVNDGLGHGEVAIFPISVFQLKAGVNYNPEDPNYDLFKRACEVSAKRLFPNFVNLDAPYNLQYYVKDEPNTHVATMGCRTRVMSNVNGPEESGSRGNFAFTTINLPMLALEAKGNLDEFWKLLDKYIDISRAYLEKRYEFIASRHVYNYPFLMGQGVWMDSEKLKPDDEIGEVLKHASISIGFCGLAECLVALCGAHHGASEDAQALGLEIVGHIRKRTDKMTEETHMNWSCFGTPAESTAGTFLRACRKKYGIIPGVTDRDYFTNSSHVPVYYPIKAIDKIRIEAPYHALENAGHIAYIEMDGDPSKNIKAFETLVRAMHDADMGYFSINHPVDRDPVCGYTGIIENECPHCHRKETMTGTEEIPRITA